MARLSDLVTILERRGVDTGATLSQFARVLREAGRVSKAKRGRGAAEMTYLDGARFLIARAATEHPSRAERAEKLFSGLVLRESTTMEASLHMDKGTPLDVALSGVLESIAQCEISQAVKLELYIYRSEGLAVFRLSESSAVIEMRFVYDPTEPPPALNSIDDAEALEAWAAKARRESHQFASAIDIIAKVKSAEIRAVATLVSGGAAGA